MGQSDVLLETCYGNTLKNLGNKKNPTVLLIYVSLLPYAQKENEKG
jgi:hypothetical protein